MGRKGERAGRSVRALVGVARSLRPRPELARPLALRLRRWCTGLGGRLVLLMALAAGLSGVVIGVAVMERARQGLREDILRRQLVTADLAAATTATFLNTVQDEVRELAGRPTLGRLVEWGDWSTATAELEHWVRSERRGIDAVYMYDAGDRLRAAGQGDRGLEGPAEPASAEVRQRLLTTGQPQLLPATRSSVTGQPIVPYLVAMRDGRGAIRGLVRAEISLRFLSEKVLEVQPGVNGRMGLIDLDNRIMLAHPNPARVLQPSSGDNPAVEQLYLGLRGAIENTSSRGEPMLGAFAPVQTTRWGVLVQQPLADAYAPLDAMERDAIRLIALALLVAAGVGGLVSLWVVRPLGRLRAAADAMANGDLARRTGVTRQDEIGDLADAFDRMAAELEARDARLAGALQRLRSVVDAVDDGIVVCGADERVISCNPAGKRFFGRSGPALFGRPLRSLVGELPAGLAASDAVVETVARRPDGSELPIGVVVRATPVRSGHQYVAVLHDLSARKAAERAAALEELNRLQSEFISIASHELRTPATAVLGFSEILVDRLAPDDPNRDIAAMVHGQSIQLATLLEDVLDASRLEAGRVQLHLEPVDLSNMVDALLASVAGRSASHRLVAEIEPNARALAADPMKLKRVLGNLVDNAVKYSPHGGTVTISARRLESPGWVEIAVADEGIGIPIDQLESVFDRFHRVDATDTRRVRGTGLGLYIVRQLVELHGGKIRAESRPGGGSVFRLELPPGSAGAAVRAAESPAAGVLVV